MGEILTRREVVKEGAGAYLLVLEQLRRHRLPQVVLLKPALLPPEVRSAYRIFEEAANKVAHFLALEEGVADFKRLTHRDRNRFTGLAYAAIVSAAHK